MTKDEVDALLKAEREKWKKESDEESKKQADLAQGKYKDLYEREQIAKAEEEKKRVAAEKQTRELKVRDSLREYIQKNAAEYAGSSSWIYKAIDIADDDDDAKITAKIKEAVENFKKDNPLKTANNSGAPDPTVFRGRTISHAALKGDIEVDASKDGKGQAFRTLGWRG